MPIVCSEATNQYAVRLQGEIGIVCAPELKEALIRALASGRAVSVVLDDAKELDVTAIQLLWAAVRDARGDDVALAIEGNSVELLARGAREMGLVEFSAEILRRTTGTVGTARGAESTK